MHKTIVALSALLLIQSNTFASGSGKQNVVLDKKMRSRLASSHTERILYDR